MKRVPLRALASRRLLERHRREPAPAPTTRYGGPDWEYRRRRVIERLSIDLVLDVGANQGQYGFELRQGGYEGAIVSFEPASEPFAALREAARRDPAWQTRRLAVGAAPGVATLNIAANEAKSSSLLAQRGLQFGTTDTMRYVATEDVEVTTLGSTGPEVAGADAKVLLKVDVQGLELDVIEGAGSFLPRVLAIETELSLLTLYEGQPGWRTIVDALEDRGFALHALDPGYSDWDTGRLVEMDGLFVRGDLLAPGSA